MSNLSKEYDRILSEIEQTISNEQEREIVKQKVTELSNFFINIIDDMHNNVNEKLEQMEEKQKELDSKVQTIQKSIHEIETDIYDEESDEYDFEIVCPYCNNEFTTDLSLMNEEKTEIKCPECNNIIELDWNEDCDCDEEESCNGHCGSCHGCGEDECDEDENEDDM